MLAYRVQPSSVCLAPLRTTLKFEQLCPESQRALEASGFATAQCGKALPFRLRRRFILRGCASEIAGIASKHDFDYNGKAKPFRTVRRQSRDRIDFSGKQV